MTARRLLQLFAWACIATIAVLSLVAPSLRPVTVLPHDLEHAAIFALAACAGVGAAFVIGKLWPTRQRPA